MPRAARICTSQQAGSYHIVSRIAGGALLLRDEEKEYLYQLLERFASGFFVQIHAFCMMGNHFHILASNLESDSEHASARELIRRYQRLYGTGTRPPAGAQDTDGTVVPDTDEGMQRLRARLGSVSRFVQEFKQTFSRWYNKRNRRKGYLWSDRFKGVIVDKGDAQLVCSAYIDLNPVRAGIVNRPEDYRWSSMGLRVRHARKAHALLAPIDHDLVCGRHGFPRYRLFVSESGGIPREHHARLPECEIRKVAAVHGALALQDKLQYKLRNLSEGLALGAKPLIEGIQRRQRRKFIKPRSVFGGGYLFATRILGGGTE